jgi:general stress protein 26
MNSYPGLKESFRQARVVFLTTFDKTGSKRTRQMMNFNEDIYSEIWFPTETRSRKVEDIKVNQKVLVTFPAEGFGDNWEVEGKAELERQEVVDAKWVWWYLSWRPYQADRFWFPPKNESDPNHAIIKITPIKATLNPHNTKKE